jgi:peptidoglycan/LPS O-acetylase OafA/YrhL
LFFAIFHHQNKLYNLKIYFLNITFLKGFFENLKFTGIAQAWSLTVEECFYLAAPLFFVIIKKNIKNLLIIPIIFLCFGFFVVYFLKGHDIFGLMNSLNFMLDFTLFGRITEFFIGIVLSVFMNKINLGLRNYTNFGIFFIILFILILSIIKPENGYGTDCVFGKIINNLLLPFFGIAPLFYGLITENTFFSKVLSSRILILLGKSSYVFYLIHLGFVINILNKLNQNIIFIFIALNLISIFIYQFIEKPMNKKIRSFFIAKD